MRWACLACSPPPPPSTSPTATWTTHMSCLASCPPPAPPSPTSTSATTSSVTLVFADFSSHPPLLFKSLIGLEITWKPESWPGKPIFYLIINLYFIVFERWSLHKRVRSVFYFPDLPTSSPWPTSFSLSLTLNQSRTSSLLWRKLSEGLLAPGSHHQQTNFNGNCCRVEKIRTTGWATKLLDAWKAALKPKETSKPPVSFYGVRKVLCPVENTTTVQSNKAMFRRLSKNVNDNNKKPAPCIPNLKRPLGQNCSTKSKTTKDDCDHDSKRLKVKSDSPNEYEKDLLALYMWLSFDC